VLDAGRMWYVIAVLVVLAVGIGWMRRPAREPAAEPVAIVAARDGGRAETITRGQCLAQPHHVWVALEDGAECIAYIASNGRTSSDTAVLFFEGDFPEEDMTPGRMARMTAGYRLRAEEAQTHFGLPFVVVARPGLMGSSGFHLIGGRRDEGEVMSGAVDAIKQRYGYRRLALAGQSGGARIVAQLLVLGRRDILCAVMGSGAYGVPLAKGGGHIGTNIFGEPGRKYLVPMHGADSIAVSTDRRAFVIGDPRDARTPFSGQREWAEKMQALGHHAALIEAAAQDPEHHGLSAVALYAAGMCAGGSTDKEIAAFASAGRQWRR